MSTRAQVSSGLRLDLDRLLQKLNALPDRSVVIDGNGDAWQKSSMLGNWYRAYDGEGMDPYAAVQRMVTATVIHT